MAKRVCDPTSGSIAQETYLISRNGQAVRARVVPANPRTLPQTGARANLSTISEMWRHLTQNQRNAWNVAAAAIRSKPRLGMSGTLTGQQFFCRINVNLTTFGQDTVDTPPTPPEFPALAPQNLVITNTSGVIVLKLTCPADPGQNTICRGSAPVSQGIQRVPRVAILGMVPTPAQGTADITSIYSAKWGMPAAGQKVFMQCSQLVDGYESLPTTFNAIVPAA